MNCAELKRLIVQWIGEEFECRLTDSDSLIATLPLLKPNGDPIEIALEQIDDHRWTISDLGETYAGLFLGGTDLSQAYVRGYEFRQILEAHSIQDDGSELSAETSSSDLIERVFDFAHAIQSMLALQFTIKPEQPSRDFASIVAKFLAEQRASFEVPTHVDGKTGRWKFNFVLNHIREETLIKTVSVTNRIQAIRRAEESVFEIRDVQELRGTPNINAVVIADDEGDRDALWSQPVVRIFEGYDIPMYRFEGSRKQLIELARKYVTKGT
jgi:hypothetical protein